MAIPLLSLLLQATSSITYMASFLLFRGVAAALLLLVWIIKLPGFIVSCALYGVRELVILLAGSIIQSANSAQSDYNRALLLSFNNISSYVSEFSSGTITAVKQQGEEAFQWASHVYCVLLPEAFELILNMAVDMLKIVFENIKGSYEFFVKYVRKFGITA